MQTTSGKSTSGKELSVSFSKSDVVSFVVGEQPSPADDFEVPVASDKGKFPSHAIASGSQWLCLFVSRHVQAR